MGKQVISLQEYKETKREEAISSQKASEAEFKREVLSIAAPTPTTDYSTASLDWKKVKDRGTLVTEDRCVCCGKPVEEGTMVCEDCLHKNMVDRSAELPPKTWERTPEERWGEEYSSKKKWFRKLLNRFR